MPDKTVLGQNMVLDIDMLTKLSVFHDLENRGGGQHNRGGATLERGLVKKMFWLSNINGCFIN